MTLTEAQKRFGVSLSLLKQYVSFGFIKPCESTYGAGEYRETDFNRLGLIDVLLSAGFSTEETRKYLDLTENEETDEEQIRMLRKYRRVLLNDIHKKQKTLDQLDFLIWEKK